MKPVLVMVAVLAFFALPAPPAAAAQPIGPNLLDDHDLDQPIDIVADRLRVDQSAKVATFEGSVEAIQGDLKFKTATLRVFYEDAKGGANPTIARVDALGGVSLESPTEVASGQTAVYDIKARIITVLGDVVLKREGSEIRGERLEYDLATGMTKFDGKLYSTDSIRTGERVVGRFKVADPGK
ncbi:MAG TPA: LptA/OstA family protein [Sphingomonadales bacterium]|nr:LptA/OstA family protein [Sphingomonadales bacterium]